MPFQKRDLHYVDPKIRKALITKIVFYWGACLVFSTLPLIIGTSIVQSDQVFVEHIGELARRYWPLYLIVMGLLPFAIRDALRITNRTLGPLARLREELVRFRETGNYRTVSCREGDFLKELIGEINLAITHKANRDADKELTGSSA